MEQAIPSLVLEEQGRALPLWRQLHNQNLHCQKTAELPVGNSDHIVSLRLLIQDKKFATLLNVYTPENRVKEAFYCNLHNLLQHIDSKDKFLILGRDFDLWKGVLGRYGIGDSNDNGRLLLEFCSEHQLIIINTLFQQKDRLNATWRHPCSIHCDLDLEQ